MDRKSLVQTQRARDHLQEGRTMLLTNTINAQTINTTIAGGNVTVCGVEIRGCSACPATLADWPSEKPARKRISERVRRATGRAMRAMYFADQPLQLWLDHPSHPAASGLTLGFASGHSLS